MRIKVKVKTSSGKNAVEKEGVDSFVVCTTKSPQKNEANEAVIKLLAKHFKVAKSRVEIVRGKKSKEKIVEIS